jgi:uncharacterized protein YraI
MNVKSLSLAGGLLLLSAGAAAAAPAVVSNDLNLRGGPGTGYRVLNVLPAGSTVDVLGCGRYWCRVSSAEGTGYASSNYLDLGAGAYAEAPPPVYAPSPVYASPPLLGFSFGWDNDWDGGWHRDWDGGWRGGGDDDD